MSAEKLGRSRRHPRGQTQSGRRPAHRRAARPWLALVAVLASACAPGERTTATVASPDGRTILTFALTDGQPTYAVTRDGVPLLEASRLGVELSDGGSFDRGLTLAGQTNATVDTTWALPWGEVAEVRDAHNELAVVLERMDVPRRRMAVRFRVFDDGFGFRYEWPEQPELSDFEITEELTQFALADRYDAWWIPAYERDRYEYLYQRSPVASLGAVHTPLTLQPTVAGRPYLSVHEADLTDYASMTLEGRISGGLDVDLVPWSDGVKVRATAPHHSPWRTVQIGASPGALAESHLILNLAEPNRIDDTSWIEPQKYIGIWWGMHVGKYTWGSGPTHGATTANAERYIDFAAANGFKGVLVEGWNVGWDGDWLGNGSQFDFTHAYPDYDLEAVQSYALEHGVSLVAHNETSGDVRNYETQLEDAFALYERLGIRALKTGYVEFGRNIDRGDGQLEWHHGQYMVRHYRTVLEAAARHHIMLDVHEPIKPTGIRRTYPNMMTREGARGQEYSSGAGEPNPPEHVPILAFTRMLAGPMDFTPGTFAFDYGGFRGDRRFPSTLARELALYVVLYSPLQMASDLIESYQGYEAGLNGGRSALQFIRDVPVDWEFTRVPAAAIGDYAVFVRKDRHSDDWFLGAVTDEEARTVDVALDFLAPGRTWIAEIYADGPQANFETNQTDIDIHDQEVTSASTLTLSMGRGGGAAIRFRPVGS